MADKDDAEGDSTDRRDFLTGRAAAKALHDATGRLIGAGDQQRTPPEGRDTVRIAIRAMACEFSVILNPGTLPELWPASDALDVVHVLEQQMSAYRSDSEISEINSRAADAPVPVESRLFRLLLSAREIANQTDQAFDMTAGPLVALWKACRNDNRIPTQEEIDSTRECVGMQHVQFDESADEIAFDRPGIELNLGAIGKGYALDRVSEALPIDQVPDVLLHGGRSSVLARGDHAGTGGWPVGIGNPLLTNKRLGTILLRDQALATSGSNIQYFRHEGRRYGHILDPRSGWPVENMLSVTVLAPTAAQADALSTAFFVMGVENAAICCDNLDGVSAILIPFPRQGRRVEPINLGVPEQSLFWDAEQVSVS